MAIVMGKLRLILILQLLLALLVPGAAHADLTAELYTRKNCNCDARENHLYLLCKNDEASSSHRIVACTIPIGDILNSKKKTMCKAERRVRGKVRTFASWTVTVEERQSRSFRINPVGANFYFPCYTNTNYYDANGYLRKMGISADRSDWYVIPGGSGLQ